VELIPAAFFTALLCAGSLMPRGAAGQEFGGVPPWGIETPVSFSGTARPDFTFEHPIGAGLAVQLVPTRNGWEIDVGRPGDREDYATCANPPFHGSNPKQILASDFIGAQGPPDRGVGQKRWIDFVLTTEELKAQCLSLERALNDGDTGWRPHATGRCWLRPLRVNSSQDAIDSLNFEGECALHGAWELWRLPATYVIPDGFTGWVTVHYRRKGKPELPRDGNRYVLRIGGPAAIDTSSNLREDDRGAQFIRSDGRFIPTEGPGQMIWDWRAGDAGGCAPFQSFFIGTADRHRGLVRKPVWENPSPDCSLGQ